VLYVNGYGVEKDYYKAHYWFMKAVDKNDDSDSLFYLGLLWETGLGCKINYDQAIYYYERGASTGDSNAQYNLGLMHYEGRGVPEDHGRALGLFLDSAKDGDGDGEAMYYIAYMYLNSQGGLDQNYEMAMTWLRKAAAKGHPDAQNNIGVLYESGLGIEQNYENAMVWYMQAAESGSVYRRIV
jgi:TPR repeat protein